MDNGLQKNGSASHKDNEASVRGGVPGSGPKERAGDVIRRRFGRNPVPVCYDGREPPDGGWGWAVAAGCFIGGVFTITGMATFGVILPELLVMFDTTTATVSWIPTAALCVSHFCGPIYAVIVSKINCRKSLLLGGFLSSFGITVSYFAPNIEVLILTYGIIAGFGGGICHLAFPVILSQYFRKYYGIASGILTASFAVPRLLLTPLMQYLLEEYGTRSLFLFAGALILNTWVGACLCQPSKWHVYSVRTATSRGAQERLNTNYEPASPLLHQPEKDDYPTNEKDEQSDDKIDSNADWPQETKVLEFKRDYSDEVSACGENTKRPAPSIGESCCFFRAFSGLDYKLFREPIFYALVANHVLFVTLMIYVPMFLLSFGLEIGLTPMDSATIVSATAIGDIVGRVGGPFLITAFKLRVRLSLMAFSLLNAILIFVLSFSESYVFCMAVSVTSGFIWGCLVALNSVVIIETMGSKRLPSVLGLTTCVSAFFIMPMAPFMGWIRDFTGSFRNVYIFLSILQLTHFIIWMLKPLFARKTPR